MLPNNQIILSHSWLTTANECGHKFELEVLSHVKAHNQALGTSKLMPAYEFIALNNEPKFKLRATDLGTFWHELIQQMFEQEAKGLSEETLRLNAYTFFLTHCPLDALAPPSRKFSMEQGWRTLFITIDKVISLFSTYELFSFTKWAGTEGINSHSLMSFNPVEFTAGLQNLAKNSSAIYIGHIDLVVWNKIELKPELLDIKSTTIISEAQLKQLYSTQCYGYTVLLAAALKLLNPVKYAKLGKCLHAFTILYIDINYKQASCFLLNYSIERDLFFEWAYDVKSTLNRIITERKFLPSLVRRQSTCVHYKRVCYYYDICRLSFNAAETYIKAANSPLEIPSLMFDWNESINLLKEGF